MRITTQIIVEENQQRIALLLPYLIAISGIVLMYQSIFVKNNAQIQGTLLIFSINMSAFLAFRYLQPRRLLLWAYILGVFYWGIHNMLQMPAHILGHVILTSIFYCLCFFIIYEGWNIVILLLPGLIVIGNGLFRADAPFMYYYMGTYVSTAFICLLLTQMNRKLWEVAYKQKMTLIDEEAVLKQNVEIKEGQNALLVQQLESVLLFGQDIFDNTFEKEEDFLRFVFNKALQLCPIAKCGSVYTLENEEVYFITCLGHDLEKLRNLSIREELFLLNKDGVSVIKNIKHNLVNTGENHKQIQDFLGAITPMKETITFQIHPNKERTIGFCLDIPINSDLSFNEDDIRAMEAFQTIIRFYYVNERFVSLQSHFKGDLIRSLANFLELHDLYTKGHSNNVADYSKMIAEQMGFDAVHVEEIYWAGVLHDIGKMLIPSTVLNKKESLTPEELNLIRTHPDLAARALLENPELSKTAKIIRSHHEWYDGSGYPQGLAGDSIPIESRIIAVADSFEAMTSDRPYKKKMTATQAVDELLACAGTQFDPEIVSQFAVLIIDQDLAS